MATRSTCLANAVGLALCVATAAPLEGGAQAVTGVVIEEGRNTPVGGAFISLTDRSGSRRASTIADSLGVFRISPPEAGEYYIDVIRIGYMPLRSPLLALGTDGVASLELIMRPQAIGLEGLEVSVEREAEALLAPFGLTPARLRNRWIGRDAIDRMTTPGFPKDVIRWQNISGLSIDEVDPSKEARPELCVRFLRRSRACALTVLNGAIVPRSAVFHLDTRDIEAIAILEPIDAATFYGTQGGGGAVLIWTRRGRS